MVDPTANGHMFISVQVVKQRSVVTRARAFHWGEWRTRKPGSYEPAHIPILIRFGSLAQCHAPKRTVCFQGI